MPSRTLVFAAGSNAHGQLGNGTMDDSNSFNLCHFAVQSSLSPLPPSSSVAGGVPKSGHLNPSTVSPTAHVGFGKPKVAPPEVNLQHKLCEPMHLPHATSSSDCKPDVIKIASGANHTLILLRKGHYHQPEDPTHGGSGSPIAQYPSIPPIPTLIYGSGDSSKGQLNRQPPSQGTKRFERIHLTHETLGYHVVNIAAAWETSYFVLRHLLQPERHPDVLIAIGGNDFGELARTQRSPPPSGIGGGGSRSKGKGKEKQLQSSDLVGAARENVVSFDHLLRTTDAPLHISSITASIHHVIVILDLLSSTEPLTRQQIVVGWGACRHGQLGPQVAPPPCPIRDGAKTTPPQSFTSTPTQLLASTQDPVCSVGVGAQHTVLLHESGAISAWGSNRKHQLQGVSSEVDIVNIGCTWNGTYLVTAALSQLPGWSILATGSGDKGQLGRADPITKSGGGSASKNTNTTAAPVDPIIAPVNFPNQETPATRIKKLACGSEHVLALLDAGQPGNELTELWAWGWNEHGNLGFGHKLDRHLPTIIDLSDSLQAVRDVTVRHRILDIWAGCGTSWIAMEIDEDAKE
ncbi:hypothetical protein FRB96_009671 [Tulasnella sp. 330]|nr:hypothetical protein FRB96_009671 [Tulasnella sp. 330]KAG8883304.1 hypothetical protein FRB97_006868 [Tulasnella sp. 331]